VITFPHPMGFNTVKAALTLNPKPAFDFTSAADSTPLPHPKPRAMREHFVVPSIRSREVARAQRSGVRQPKMRSSRSISAVVCSASIKGRALPMAPQEPP
jgi:hypothetical protein